MPPITDLKQAAQNRIAETVNLVKQENSVFEELDSDLLVQDYLSLFLEKYQPEEILAFSEERLTSSIRDLMAWGMLYGLISDFTPEQMKAFDDAVQNKW